MKIVDSLNIIKAEEVFERTPLGIPLSDYAKNTIKATISDEKNYEAETYQCANCGFLASSLLFEDGCKNCGFKVQFEE